MKTKKLLMIPGPTPVSRSIQDEMGRETIAFSDENFINDFNYCLTELNKIVKSDGEVFVISGSGTLAMEMSLSNVLKKGDNLLVVSHGFFGDRFIEIAKNKGINVDVLSSEWGKTVPIENIRETLKKKDYKAITVTHVDTSTGVKAELKEIGNMLKEFPEIIYIVDGVCATAGEAEYMNDMNIDILFTASQKAFGVAPGLLILWANEKAMLAREKLGSISEYFLDFKNWLPIMHDPSKYFATPSVNLIWALNESIRLINEEGIENRFYRHELFGKAIQKALEGLGFDILAEEKHRANTLSNVIYPDGVNDELFRKILAKEGVQVAAGLGAYKGKMFRIGHMGNIDKHYLISSIASIERTLYEFNIDRLSIGLNIIQRELINKSKG
ncbi:MAG: alanine--glyoxylate aminotransferase family protein [Tissierellales bacterium]|nr:alanine--glyoxylate aminotransferase family protein [Tissierellales bacterium]